MAVKLKIKKGDSVKVITGDDKGKTGKVLAVYPKTLKVVVEGCKIAKKAIKPVRKTQIIGLSIKKCQWIFPMWQKFRSKR